jgi:hypothetical protein
MTEQEYNQAQAGGGITAAPQDTPQTESPPDLPVDMGAYLGLLETMIRPKRHLTAAPTFKPKNFAEQIQFYDDATNRRIYLYINGSWRYVALT